MTVFFKVEAGLTAVREAGLKAEQPIISRSHSKPVSCLRGRGEEAAAASALPDTERPEKRRSECCKAFVQNCGKTAEKVRVLNPLTGKSVRRPCLYVCKCMS